MRYGLEVIPFDCCSDPRQVVKIAQIAEAAEWQGLWRWDHLVWHLLIGLKLLQLSKSLGKEEQ